MKTDVNHTLEIRGGRDYALGVDTGRNRRNREALLDAGRSIGHAFSVRELHETARRDQPRLGLTTAYRAIERWRDQGLVEDAGTRAGEAVFVMCGADGHHHHLVCVECGAISTLEGCALVSLRQAAASVGFELSDRGLQSLPGRCARCASL
jgi:Fur family ferric uptake transcriptional regulator